MAAEIRISKKNDCYEAELYVNDSYVISCCSKTEETAKQDCLDETKCIFWDLRYMLECENILIDI